jgi:hypothetical protein
MKRLARRLALLLTLAGICLMTGGADGRLGTYLLARPQEERMKAVEEILDLPDTVRAFAIFPYGYPAEERKQQDRFDPERIHYVE